MKRIYCFIVALVMMLSVVSCNTASNSGETITEAVSNETAETLADDTKPSAPKYDGVFKVGYSRVVISPELPAKQKT